MLRSIKEIYGNTLGASDGDIGQVKDFYFDDQSWAIRYLVADTGTWLAERQVLISPLAFAGLHGAGKTLPVSLTRKQIEDSPPIGSHTTVSRQYEVEYHKYYGWANYWEGESLPGMNPFPTLQSPQILQSDEKADAHLRSTQAVNGYHIQGSDGIIGHVCDFMMDDMSWAIQQLVIKTGNRFSGREVQISVSNVARISYEDSTIFVNLTKDTIEQSPAPYPTPVSVGV